MLGVYSFLTGLFDFLLLFFAFLFVDSFGCNVFSLSKLDVISAPETLGVLLSDIPLFGEIRFEMR